MVELVLATECCRQQTRESWVELARDGTPRLAGYDRPTDLAVNGIESQLSGVLTATRGIPAAAVDVRYLSAGSGLTTGLISSSRQVPDLAGEARCQGSARSGAEGREGRRP